MKIRMARETDVPWLIILAQRSWLSGFTDSGPIEFIKERIDSQFERDWYPKHWPTMTIAEEAGVLLGVVQPCENEINGLWVSPEAQGQGVGSTLLQHAELMIVGSGYKHAWLTCSGFNPKASRFYRSRGYYQTARNVKQRSKDLVEEVFIFEKVLAGNRKLGL